MTNRLSLPLLLVAIVLAGCGGGGSGGPAEPAGPWAGTWTISDALNTDSRFDHCIGLLASLEDELVIDPSDPVVCNLDSFTVTHHGDQLRIPPRPFTYSDGTQGTVSAEGTVSGDVAGFHLRYDYAGGIVEFDGFGAIRDGDVVALEWGSVSVSNGFSGGSCLILPPVRYQALIQR